MHLLGIQLILLDAILFIYYALLAAPRRLWALANGTSPGGIGIDMLPPCLPAQAAMMTLEVQHHTYAGIVWRRMV